MGKLDGKVALVTGASRGIGQAVAALRGALESLVGMRLASDVPDQSVIDNGTQTVEQRRQDLDAAISGVQAVG